MERKNAIDPVLLEVWRHLSSTFDVAAATAFFHHNVIDGDRLVEEIRRRQHTANDAPPPADAPFRRSGPKARPKTEFNPQRHREIIDRKWLVTGYVGVLRQTGALARRIPLNYRNIRLGTADVHPDIVVDLGTGSSYAAHLELVSGNFVLRHERGSVKARVNGREVDKAEVSSGDRIQIGPYELAIFKTLEDTAELTVVSDPGAGERFAIDIAEMRIGRPGRRANDINLPSPTVSREHATIKLQENKFWLAPETSSSPTVVNGAVLRAPRMLVDNDQVVLGEQTMLFRTRGTAARPKTLQSRKATVLFSDLRGWTALAETTPLEELILQLDEYYKAMGDIIQRYGGTLMAYQGDALMAVFGAPSVHADDPWRAVVAALRMLEVRDKLNERWRSRGKAEFIGGIGIHTGQVMVGEIGHASRLEYSAMGDATNLAARLEQLTKEYGCPLIISDATHAEVATLVEGCSLGTVTVKGRSTPTTLYRVDAIRNL